MHSGVERICLVIAGIVFVLGGTSQSCAVPMGISICLPVAMNTKLVHANVRLGVFCMVNFVHDRGMLFNRLKQSH